MMHDMESRESSNKKLLLAAAYGEIRSVEKYLADGTDVNCRDMHGWTPLHCAAQNGHKTTVFLLLSQGAVINSKAYNGSTPLHCAASGCGRPINGNMKYGTQGDYIAIVDCLISMGSVADIKEENNKTPYDLASNDEMRKRLKAAEEGIKAGLPIQLIHLDEKSVSGYKRLLKEDSYQLFELRLMIQGEQGTGKSTITRFLIGMHTPLFKNSDEDIGVYSGLSFFDDENNIWLGGQQDFTLEDILVSRAIQNMSKKQRLDTLPAEINVKEAQAPVQKPADNSKVIKNVGIIEKLKDFFGITKEVEEIKISVTVNGLYEKSRQVAKQKFFKRKIVPVTILDLKGNDFLFSTHQTFLTSRAVYMLVLDGSRTLNEPCLHEVFLPGRNRAAKTQRDYLRFCINNIMTYCKGEKSGFPKIIVILTHKDKLKDTEIEKRREEIFGEIDQMFDGTPIKQHLANEDKIFVNARNNNDPEMEKIKHSAILQAKLQPTWGERLPKCFLPLELEIQCLVKKGIPIITMEDIEKINDKQAVRPLTDSEIKTFLKWQHSAGKILYFDEPYLNKYIIISPICLIDAFKSIITGKQFQKDKEESWYHMGKKGIILKQAVEALWQQKKYTHFFNSRTFTRGYDTSGYLGGAELL